MKDRKVRYILFGVGLLCCLYACAPRPAAVQSAEQPLVLYPEYQDVTIPCNVAPLNFLLRNEGVDAVWVSVKGKSDSLQINARGNKAVFPLKAWRALLEAEKGHVLEVTVMARTNDRWLRYPSFTWQVVADRIDAYISYRLIEPGYEVWNALQIRERCIENFEERILADNSQTDGKCMNCHVHGGCSGDLSMFHLRGEGGGTVLNRDGKLRKLALKNEQMVSAAVYGDFHPGGRYGVFSSNVIIPMLHTAGNRRLEVYDTVSDLAVADFDGNRMILWRKALRSHTDPNQRCMWQNGTESFMRMIHGKILNIPVKMMKKKCGSIWKIICPVPQTYKN